MSHKLLVESKKSISSWRAKLQIYISRDTYSIIDDLPMIDYQFTRIIMWIKETVEGKIP